MGCSCSTPKKERKPRRASSTVRDSTTQQRSDFEAIDFVDVMREPIPRASRTNNPLVVAVDQLCDRSEAVLVSPGQRSFLSDSSRKGTGNWSDAATRHSSFAVGSALSLQSGSTVHSVRLETHLLSLSEELRSSASATTPPAAPDGSCVAHDGSTVFGAHNDLPPPMIRSTFFAHGSTVDSPRLNSQAMTPTDAPPPSEGLRCNTDELEPSTPLQTGSCLLTPICSNGF